MNVRKLCEKDDIYRSTVNTFIRSTVNTFITNVNTWVYTCSWFTRYTVDSTFVTFQPGAILTFPHRKTPNAYNKLLLEVTVHISISQTRRTIDPSGDAIQTNATISCLAYNCYARVIDSLRSFATAYCCTHRMHVNVMSANGMRPASHYRLTIAYGRHGRS